MHRRYDSVSPLAHLFPMICLKLLPLLVFCSWSCWQTHSLSYWHIPSKGLIYPVIVYISFIFLWPLVVSPWRKKKKEEEEEMGKKRTSTKVRLCDTFSRLRVFCCCFCCCFYFASLLRHGPFSFFEAVADRRYLTAGCRIRKATLRRWEHHVRVCHPMNGSHLPLTALFSPGRSRGGLGRGGRHITFLGVSFLEKMLHNGVSVFSAVEYFTSTKVQSWYFIILSWTAEYAALFLSVNARALVS